MLGSLGITRVTLLTGVVVTGALRPSCLIGPHPNYLIEEDPNNPSDPYKAGSLGLFDNSESLDPTNPSDSRSPSDPSLLAIIRSMLVILQLAV